MATTIMGCASVSSDGFIADDNDRIGPLFDWLSNGDTTWSLPHSDEKLTTTQASADFMQEQYPDIACGIIGRRLFDLTNGWNGVPAAGEHVFVVTHEPPANWEFEGKAPFTFVGGIEEAFDAARSFAGDRIIDVAAGQIGSQALQLGLIDKVIMNVVPAVFGSGRPFFAMNGLDKPILLDNPSKVVQGDRVTHVVYKVVNNLASIKR